MRGRPRQRRRWLPWLRHGGQLLVAALLVEYLVVPQFAGSGTSFRLLGDVDGLWLPVAAVSELASLVAFALATRSVLRSGVRPPFWTLLRIDLSTIAISHSVPAGSASGTAAGIRLLSRADVPVADATFAKLGQGVLAALILQVLLWGAALTAIPRQITSPIYVVAFSVGVGLMVFVVAGVVLLRRFRPTRFLFIRRMGEEIDLVLAERRRLHGAAFWSLANWLLDSFALFASLLAFGHVGLGYDEILIAFAIANTLNWVPITPGGLGLVEGALIPMMVGFGATHSIAILGVITWRLLSFWLPIPLGGLAYASLWSSRRRSAAVVPGSDELAYEETLARSDALMYEPKRSSAAR